MHARRRGERPSSRGVCWPARAPQGVKLGDFQATLMGMLSAALFFVISHATPLEALSAQRPHPNIFSPYVFLSLLGQFAAHMAFLVYMYCLALAAMPKVGFLFSWGASRRALCSMVCH